MILQVPHVPYIAFTLDLRSEAGLFTVATSDFVVWGVGPTPSPKEHARGLGFEAHSWFGPNFSL